MWDTVMRYCYLIVALLLADVVMFDGRYRGEVWQEAKEAGTRASYSIAHQLRGTGLGFRR
jgi:hypothetical protein